MESIDWGDNDLLELNLLRELVFEIEELLRTKHLVNIFLIYSNVVDLDQNGSSIVFNTHEAAFLRFDIKSEYFSTGSRKIPGVLENMETNEIAAEQALYYLIPVGKCSVYVGARKVRMLIETNISVVIWPLEI